MQDRFEAGLDFQVQIATAVARHMLARPRLLFNTRPGGLLRTHTFENHPGLVKLGCDFQNPVNLITTRKGAAIQNHDARRIPAKHPAHSFQHDLHHEIILRGGVFQSLVGKQCEADLILAENRSANVGRNGVGESGLSCTRQSSH